MSQSNVQFSVATHMMTALGFHYGEELTSTTLAESVNADPSFVRKTLSKLAKAGLVRATRGRNGSSHLARPPDEITLLDIYRASEGPPAFVIHAYPIERTCPTSTNFKTLMGNVLDDAQKSFEESLARQTLASLVAGVRAAM
jgi:Rrf2 family protein